MRKGDCDVEAILAQDIGSLGFWVRAYNRLKSLGVHTVGDLAQRDPFALRGFNSYNEMLRLLSSRLGAERLAEYPIAETPYWRTFSAWAMGIGDSGDLFPRGTSGEVDARLKRAALWTYREAVHRRGELYAIVADMEEKTQRVFLGATNRRES